MVASAALVGDMRRASTSDLSMPRPDLSSSFSPSASRVHTVRGSVRVPRTDSTAAATSAFATNTPTAPESRRIYSTCSGEDVS